MVAKQGVPLREAADLYLVSLGDEQRRENQQEVDKFIRWCGRDRGVEELTPVEIADYGESVAGEGYDLARVAPVKAFLTYMKKAGLTPAALASHLRLPKVKKTLRLRSGKQPAALVELTAEGYAQLQSRRQVLLVERVRIVGDIQRAMADKDFRENAPLDAAKEKQSQIESMLREVESTLENAVIRQKGHKLSATRVKQGHTVILKELDSGKESKYTLVDSTEADPAKGKISDSSPVGRALLGKSLGDEVHISVPRGTMHYRIEKIQA